MIRACVFDMDGVLIDTEPVWRRVEREIFGRVGVELTEEQLLETWGMRISEVVDYWYRSRPWDGVRPQAVAKAIVDEVVAHVRIQGRPAHGAVEAIARVHAAGLRIAIASSSSRRLIHAVVERLEVTRHVEALLSADDEQHGKPAPDVYLSAARKVGLAPDECIAVEDSPVGVQSAKAAGMLCVALVTHGIERSDLQAADAIIGSLDELEPELWERLASGGMDIVGRRRP
jgi:mannitol-1-/sugar-/sorbitol-6-/2-deoxyglucose-6-phosphatase